LLLIANFIGLAIALSDIKLHIVSEIGKPKNAGLGLQIAGFTAVTGAY